MKEIFKSVFAIMLSIFFVSGCAPERDRSPNVLLIMADDLTEE